MLQFLTFSGGQNCHKSIFLPQKLKNQRNSKAGKVFHLSISHGERETIVIAKIAFYSNGDQRHFICGIVTQTSDF